MNILTLLIFGYILIATILIYFAARDTRRPKLFFARHKMLAWIFIAFLGAGVLAAVDARFVEPKLLLTKRQTVEITGLAEPIKIALVTDMQLGTDKKTAWAEKIVKKIQAAEPDLIILGGDLIDNEGSAKDETVYLEPLAKLAGEAPIFYVMGNHEHGMGTKVRDISMSSYWTGDKSADLEARMKKLDIPQLRDELNCPEIKKQIICVYGIDDIWFKTPDFKNLKNVDTADVLVFATHNPDGVLYWPKDKREPDLVLAGHTHGGQVRLPFFGSLADAGVELGEKYYRGLNYWRDIPIYTSVGAGESGGPVRFLAPPEIVILELKKR